jgi:hypothetical protein
MLFVRFLKCMLCIHSWPCRPDGCRRYTLMWPPVPASGMMSYAFDPIATADPSATPADPSATPASPYSNATGVGKSKHHHHPPPPRRHHPPPPPPPAPPEPVPGWEPFNDPTSGRSLLGEIDLAFLGSYACECVCVCVDVRERAGRGAIMRGAGHTAQGRAVRGAVMRGPGHTAQGCYGLTFLGYLLLCISTLFSAGWACRREPGPAACVHGCMRHGCMRHGAWVRATCEGACHAAPAAIPLHSLCSSARLSCLPQLACLSLVTWATGWTCATFSRAECC